ncbi:Quinol oxidase subunit 4 [Paraliobacillus sp. PM-2]|uniref:cytochrome aa3 quinol oxidase subunit IV n=1 Tax=Paraliobacillus sp. PM-2 TaxID=1462524 RepID=UPI00061C3884|nr:cytochrome aa3 quinol oxidase subunit IV [Paraliobacillus sp. PM-2]CQR47073.1 Quinol oxidase subunit 4 [Paraliobacillus sp. PM-2]
MKKQFPLNHVVGFILSVVLTIFAVFIALETDFTTTIKLWIIGAFAIFQAFVQLIMFMHMTEGKAKVANIINISYSIFLAVVIVAGSIWILTTGHAAH